MGEFLNAMSAVFVIFLIMMVGYLLGHLGWLTASEKRFISLYVVNIAVPINCIVGMLGNFSREQLMGAGVMILTGMSVVFLGLVLGGIAATALKLPQKRWGVFVAMAGISNTMFIGLPLTQQLFGEVSLPAMMTYFLASSIFTQSAGVMLVERAGGKSQSKRSVVGFVIDLLKKPPVLGILASILMLLLDVRPPKLLMDAAQYISNTVTPLALIYCGYILYEVGLKNLKPMYGHGWLLLSRLVIAPLICVGMCAVTGITGLTREVFIVMSALPVVAQVTVMAGAYGADEEYAAIGTSLSMLGIFVTIPILMTIL